MDPELVLIFTFVFSLAALALIMAHIFHRRTVSHEERKLELLARTEEARSGKSAVDADAYRKLEERVRVLERIATDSKSGLALEIESLRDLHEIDQLPQSREKAQ